MGSNSLGVPPGTFDRHGGVIGLVGNPSISYNTPFVAFPLSKSASRRRGPDLARRLLSLKRSTPLVCGGLRWNGTGGRPPLSQHLIRTPPRHNSTTMKRALTIRSRPPARNVVVKTNNARHIAIRSSIGNTAQRHSAREKRRPRKHLLQGAAIAGISRHRS